MENIVAQVPRKTISTTTKNMAPFFASSFLPSKKAFKVKTNAAKRNAITKKNKNIVIIIS
jgi:hypothetical protein